MVHYSILQRQNDAFCDKRFCSSGALDAVADDTGAGERSADGMLSLVAKENRQKSHTAPGHITSNCYFYCHHYDCFYCYCYVMLTVVVVNHFERTTWILFHCAVNRMQLAMLSPGQVLKGSE